MTKVKGLVLLLVLWGGVEFYQSCFASKEGAKDPLETSLQLLKAKLLTLAQSLAMPNFKITNFDDKESPYSLSNDDLKSITGFGVIQGMFKILLNKNKVIIEQDMDFENVFFNLPWIDCKRTVRTFTGIENEQALQKKISVLFFDSFDLGFVFDLSKYPNLTHVYLRDLCFKSKDIRDKVYESLSNCQNLEVFGITNSYVYDNENNVNHPIVLDMKNKKKLKIFYADGTNFESLDFSGCENLETLKLSNCSALKEIKGLNNLKNLKMIVISKCNNLESLDLSSCDNLEKVEIFNCSNFKTKKAFQNRTHIKLEKYGIVTVTY